MTARTEPAAPAAPATDDLPETSAFEVVPTPQSMVERINELYDRVNQQVRTSVETALELGRTLCECRKSLEHGKWQRWVSTNLTFSYKTALRYQQLWKKRDQIAQITEKGHVSLLTEGGLTAVYHELDILSRQNEVDKEEAVSKKQKRYEAEERKAEREDEADLADFQSTPNISEEEFRAIQQEPPVAVPKEPAKPVIDVESTPDNDVRPELSVDDGVKIYDRTELFVDRLISEFPNNDPLDVINQAVSALDLIQELQFDLTT